ncbi:hypothetical protein SK128_007069 [Halocaridina rubra]|uniref:Uncharacterized protein n=1 Tax=Halocaridina rubra TaxID=373956 RepID=A0AAN8X662_HALRR
MAIDLADFIPSYRPHTVAERIALSQATEMGSKFGDDDFDIDLTQFELRRAPSSSSTRHSPLSMNNEKDESDSLPVSTSGKRKPLPSHWSSGPGRQASSKEMINGRPPSPATSVSERFTQRMLAPRSPPRPKKGPSSLYQGYRNEPPNYYQTSPLSQSGKQYKSNPNLNIRPPSPSESVPDHLINVMLAPPHSLTRMRHKPAPPKRHLDTAISRQYTPPRQSEPLHYLSQQQRPREIRSYSSPRENKQNLYNGMPQNHYHTESYRNRHKTSPSNVEDMRRHTKSNAGHQQKPPQRNDPPPSKISQGFIPIPPPRPPTPPQNPQPKRTQSSKSSYHTLPPRHRSKSTLATHMDAPDSVHKPKVQRAHQQNSPLSQPLSSRQRAMTYNPQRHRNEAFRPFVPFDPQAPSTPMPDYEDDTDCLYIPPPDY